MDLSGLKIKFASLKCALVGQRISFLDSDRDALQYISRFSRFFIDECNSFSYVLDQFGGFDTPWSARLDRYWYEDVGIGDACVFCLLIDRAVVCCCSCFNRGTVKEGGTVRTYLVQLRRKPSACHGSKVSKLHQLDVWRLRVTDPLAPWKLVSELSLSLSILCHWP